ncbi:MAG: 50S ribosomal protein L10 [Lachnoclostridium sp.]|jgi:large subunit ribosomal protein L10|nr:50S ribosomal protein L10 [Lachnoclostridium sp.]
MAKVEEKQPVIDEIKSQVKDAKSAVLVDYRGLTVEEDTNLRKKLREAGIIYKVYKNTMFHLAFEGTDYSQLDKHLKGPTAIAVSMDDETAPARILAEFAKGAPALEFKGAVVDGNYYDESGVIQLAKIPSRDVLISKLLGSIQSPISNFARVIKQIAEAKEKAPEANTAEEKAPEANAAETSESTPEPEIKEESPETEETTPETE